MLDEIKCKECGGTGKEIIRGGLSISCGKMPSKRVLKEMLKCKDCNGTGHIPVDDIVMMIIQELIYAHMCIKRYDFNYYIQAEHMKVNLNEAYKLLLALAEIHKITDKVIESLNVDYDKSVKDIIHSLTSSGFPKLETIRSIRSLRKYAEQNGIELGESEK